MTSQVIALIINISFGVFAFNPQYNFNSLSKKIEKLAI